MCVKLHFVLELSQLRHAASGHLWHPFSFVCSSFRTQFLFRSLSGFSEWVFKASCFGHLVWLCVSANTYIPFIFVHNEQTLIASKRIYILYSAHRSSNQNSQPRQQNICRTYLHARSLQIRCRLHKPNGNTSISASPIESPAHPRQPCGRLNELYIFGLEICSSSAAFIRCHCPKLASIIARIWPVTSSSSRIECRLWYPRFTLHQLRAGNFASTTTLSRMIFFRKYALFRLPVS